MASEQSAYLRTLYQSFSDRLAAEPEMGLAALRDLFEGWHLATVEPEGVTYAEVDAVREEYVTKIQRGDPEGAMRHFTGYWAGGDVWAGMDDSTRALMRRAAPKVLLDWQATFADGPNPEELRGLAICRRGC